MKRSSLTRATRKALAPMHHRTNHPGCECPSTNDGAVRVRRTCLNAQLRFAVGPAVLCSLFVPSNYQ
eukprot:scaffold84108_cov27-Tisochrysis_lutea.AAC.8